MALALWSFAHMKNTFLKPIILYYSYELKQIRVLACRNFNLHILLIVFCQTCRINIYNDLRKCFIAFSFFNFTCSGEYVKALIRIILFYRHGITKRGETTLGVKLDIDTRTRICGAYFFKKIKLNIFLKSCFLKFTISHHYICLQRIIHH